MAPLGQLLVLFIAQEDPSPLPDEPPVDPALVTPGFLALISFIFIAVAIVVLYRSMRKQMRRVDEGFPEEETGVDGDGTQQRT
jgi:hypothetical protein